MATDYGGISRGPQHEYLYIGRNPARLFQVTAGFSY